MSVTVFPKFGKSRVPNGTFVIFSFDPLAYAADLDEKAAEAAAHIPRKMYLGLVESVGTLDLPKMRLNLDLRVAGHAPPQEGEDDMYRRAPLKPSHPLPWTEGCYLHTLQLVNAFVSRVHHSNPTDAVISAEEIARIGHHVAVDEHEASRKRTKSEDGSATGSDSESYYPSDEGDGLSASESSSVDLPFVKPIVVYIEIWEDLSVANVLGEPKDVTRDIDEIVAIGQEWEKRMNYEYRAKAPQTSQWAAGVADSGHEDLNDVPNPPLPNISYDDELAPEDAVDERINGSDQIMRDATPEHSTTKADFPAAPLAVYHSAVSSASMEESEEEGRFVGRKGPLKFVAARAHELRSWFRHALHL